MPKVSVIIPTYNCAKYLPEAIESALNQTFQDFEIIIVNDGSADNTNQIIKPYLEQYPEKIKYFEQENKGLAITRNVAIDNSKGEYIALLDSDDTFLPNRLENGVNILSSQLDVDLTHANIKYLSEDGKDLGVLKRNPKYLNGYIFNNILLLKAHLSLPTILIRKRSFGTHGKFDENLSRLGCEDREMWLRISKDCKIVYQDTVLACYRIRQNSMSKNFKLMTEARNYVLNKYCPPTSFSNKIKRRIYFSDISNQFSGEYYNNTDYRSATKAILKAISIWPFSLSSWIILAKCLSKFSFIRKVNACDN